MIRMAGVVVCVAVIEHSRSPQFPYYQDSSDNATLVAGTQTHYGPPAGGLRHGPAGVIFLPWQDEPVDSAPGGSTTSSRKELQGSTRSAARIWRAGAGPGKVRRDPAYSRPERSAKNSFRCRCR